jgi:hypothetical protein
MDASAQRQHTAIEEAVGWIEQKQHSAGHIRRAANGAGGMEGLQLGLQIRDTRTDPPSSTAIARVSPASAALLVA